MKLALDHHYSPLIARGLRDLGRDAVAAVELAWEAEDDEPLLTLCTNTGRSLMTKNVADFAVIARQWQIEGRAHPGLIFTSDASFPRTRNTIGCFVEAIAHLMQNNPGDDSFVDRTHWL